jgi:hypothetical protein
MILHSKKILLVGIDEFKTTLYPLANKVFDNFLTPNDTLAFALVLVCIKTILRGMGLPKAAIPNINSNAVQKNRLCVFLFIKWQQNISTIF